MVEDCLYGTQRSVGERAAQPLRGVAGLVAMLLVEERVECGVEGLDLRLRHTTEEAVTLSELDGVMQHVELGERLGVGLHLPVLVDVMDGCTPLLDLLRRPVALVQEVIVQLLQPAIQRGVPRRARR